MTRIKIGTGIPAAMADPADPDVPSVVDAARQVERAGLESVWIPDLLLGDGTPALEPTLVLAAAAAVTERIRIGFSVLVVPQRPPTWLAAQVATLQHLSGNRLELGVGVGGFPDSPFWQSLGVPRSERGRITDATLALLPRLLAGKPVAIVAGAPPVTMAPTAPMPPVIIGSAPGNYRRILTHADGWFPSLISPTDLGIAIRDLREQASKAGRPIPTTTVGGHIIMGDGAGADTAYAELVRSLVDVHGMTHASAAEAPMRARTPTDLAEIFAAYQDVGADRVVAGADNGTWDEQLAFLAEANALLG